MASGVYSFIDIAVLDEIRERFAAGDALVLLSADLAEVLWANGPGAALLGCPDVETAIGSAPALGRPALRQISATPGFPAIGRDRPVAVRLIGGLTSRTISFLASAVALPDGEAAILLALPDPEAGSRGAAEQARRAIGGFAQEGHFAALVQNDGAVAAASDGFEALGIERETLRALAGAANSGERLVKKRVPGAARSLAAGLARLTDEPSLHLLVVVDEDDGAAASDPQAPGAADAMPQAPDQQTDARAATPATPSPAEAQKTRATVDRWYFGPAEPHARSPGKVQAPEVPIATGKGEDRTSPAQAAQPGRHKPADLKPGPVKFVWHTDADGRFSAISAEFGAALGSDAADIVGRTFREIAEAFGMDAQGEIAGLLERRDTWSGRSVLWPAAGTDLKVPVDLAALPVYGRDRSFQGFRGFGVARTGDAVHDPEATGRRLVASAVNEPPAQPSSAAADAEEPTEGATKRETEAATDPFRGEVPALAIAPKVEERRLSDKIIRLAEHRPPQPDSGLSASERNAFREIGNRLKKDRDTGAAAPEGGAAAAGAVENTKPSAERPAPRETKESAPPAADAPAALVPANDEVTPAAGAEEQLGDEAAGDGTKDAGKTAAAADIVPSALAGAPLAESQADFYAAILARLPAPVLIHSGDRLHYANHAFLDLTGYASIEAIEEAGGLGVLFADAYADTADADGRRLCLKNASGETFPADALLQSVPWRGGKALMLALHAAGEAGAGEKLAEPVQETDAGEQETAPAADDVDARIAELTTIIDTATDGVVLIAADGAIRSISRPAEALFGFDSAEVAGKPFVSLFAMESQRAARDYLQGLSDNGVASVLNDGREVIGREAQGRFIPLFMTIGRLPGDSGFCAVVRDITQWKRAEEELTHARAQAERSSSQKTEFLARVSHEIRTPLNAIIGFSELMIDEKFGPVANDRYRDYLRDINRSGNHVLDLVNDLLDISKIEAGEQEMNYEAVSLNDTLAETVAMMQPQANRDRVIIRSSFPSRLPEVVADLRSVRQIALNLLSNAVRYTQAGGQVIVSTSYEPSGDIIMRVRDTGIGMSQAEIEQAMKPFKQINALKRPRGEGTGLGLPLTKAMVEANRARFSISSTPGEGTLVEVTFPSTRVLAD